MKKPYYLVSILKTKFFQTIVVLTLSIGGAYAQSGQKYSTSGNDLAAGDVIGSTNNQPLIFISNRTEAFRINPNGSAIFKQNIKLKGGLQVTDFIGAGFRLIQVDADGNIVLLNGTGSAGDVLLGNGTFGNFNNMADARITNFFSGNGNQLVLDNGSFIDITTFINTYAPSLNSYFTGAANQVVNGQGQFVDFSDMLEQGMHDFGLYYSNGNLGVGTATPGSTLDVSGDLTVHGQIFLVEGKTKSEQVETKEVITKTVEAEERITSLSLKSQALRSEVIEMDSQTKIVGETNVEGAVNVSETMTIGRLYAMEEEQPQQPTLPPAAPTFRLNVFGGTSITGNAFISNKLGLGVESPTEKLDVVGNAKLSGDLLLGGNLRLANVASESNTANPIFLTLGADNKMQQFDPIANPIFSSGWQTGTFSDGSKYSNFLNGRVGINTPAEREDCYPELEEMLQVKGAGHFKPKADYANNSEEIGEKCTIIGHDGLHGVIDVSAVHTITIPDDPGTGGTGIDETGAQRVTQHTDPGHLKLGLYSGADVEINSESTNQWAYAGGSNLFVKGHVGINAPYDQGNNRLNVGGVINATGYKINGQDISFGQWTTSGSNIYNNTANVGIGLATAPENKLHVKGGVTIDASATPAFTTDGWHAAIKTPLGSIWQCTTPDQATGKYLGYGMTNGGFYMIKSDAQENGTVSYPFFYQFNSDPEQQRLYVRGSVYANEVVAIVGNDGKTFWADYVFEPNYNLDSYEEVENYYKTHHHLKGVPSAAEIKEKGLHIADMQRAQMEKIEELTIRVVDQNKKLEQQNKELTEQLKEQQKQINELIKKINK